MNQGKKHCIASRAVELDTARVVGVFDITTLVAYKIHVRSLLQHFLSISFVIYNVESIFLSSYVVRRNDLIIHTMLFNGFILMSALLLRQTSPWVLSWGQSPPPILRVSRLNPYRKIVEWIATLIPRCHSQYWRSAWNLLFSTMGQIDQVDRRFNLDPTTPNCIYLGTLN